MVLWNDNIGIFTCDGFVANKLAASFPRLFESTFHYYLKEITHLGPRSLNTTSQKHPEYLGVSFRLSLRRNIGNALCTLEWQPTSKKRVKWSSLEAPSAITCRALARIVNSGSHHMVEPASLHSPMPTGAGTGPTEKSVQYQ